MGAKKKPAPTGGDGEEEEDRSTQNFIKAYKAKLKEYDIKINPQVK